MKFIWKILKISLVITLIVILLELVFNNFEIDTLLSFKALGIYLFYSVVLSALNSIYFWLFTKKIGWENAGIRRVIIATLGSVLITLIGFFFCRLVHKTVFMNVSYSEFIANESLRFYLFPLLFTLAISLFFHVVYFYKALQEKRVTEQKIIAGTASARFDALKNQLDPHFLFNSLNVLSALIEENPAMAQKFTGSLSKIYRYVLEQKDKELVSLEEELKFAKTYMQLLEVRFEEGIHFEMPSVLANPEAKVVPLSLQLLLENTIKHNKVSPQSPLEILIKEESGVLVVENKLQPKEILKSGSGVGLKNITERYKLVTDRHVEIDKTSSKFIVKLPLLTKMTAVDFIPTSYHSDKDTVAYDRAKEQVKREKGFYGNLTSYLVIIPALAVFNYLTSDFPWAIFPAIGWGIGLSIHAMSTYKWHPFLGKDWEERKIEELMRDDK